MRQQAPHACLWHAFCSDRCMHWCGVPAKRRCPCLPCTVERACPLCLHGPVVLNRQMVFAAFLPSKGRLLSARPSFMELSEKRVQSLSVRRRGCTAGCTAFYSIDGDCSHERARWRVCNIFAATRHTGAKCTERSVVFRLAPKSHFWRSGFLQRLRVWVYCVILRYDHLLHCFTVREKVFHYLLRSVSTSRKSAKKSRIQSVQSRLSKLKQK